MSKEEIEKYLNENTFFCKRLKSRISKRQCDFNCARTIYHLSVENRRSKMPKNEMDIYKLYTSLSRGLATCKGCERFHTPDKDTLNLICKLELKSTFIPRYVLIQDNGSEDYISAVSTYSDNKNIGRFHG
jgi:hypothetical protein